MQSGFSGGGGGGCAENYREQSVWEPGSFALTESQLFSIDD